VGVLLDTTFRRCVRPPYRSSPDPFSYLRLTVSSRDLRLRCAQGRQLSKLLTTSWPAIAVGPTTPWRWSCSLFEVVQIKTDPEPRLQYAEALREYVGAGSEDWLLVGYSIGRETIAEGLTSLVALHGDALKQVVTSGLASEQIAAIIDRSTQFLEEALAPFEMTVRGFQEANDRLVRANQQLTRADEMEKRFLANMSHELRTPLNSILGFAELLIDERDAGLGEGRRRTFLETIHSSGKHLLGLINDILDLAKVDAGQMTIEAEPLAGSDSVAEVFGVVEPLASKRGITLETRVGPTIRIMADPSRLKQILLNLLSNAIKFTSDGGQIRVSARRQGAAVRFEVTDTGIGIAAEDQKLLFVEFHQLAAGLDRRQQGTGLGLALSKRLVELQGGTIGVRSVPSQGSTFWFTLPVATDEGPSAELPVQESRSEATGPLVLVVEDDPGAAELLVHYLRSAGYQTVIAADGPDALEKAKRLRPVAITLDVSLPKLDGWEVLAQLKQEEDTANIPVVVVSVVDERSRGRALGAADYFVKPISRDALIARLNRYTFATKVKERDVKVLVVDDDPKALELLAKILEPLGFSVIKAASGEEAIQLARQRGPDLVILDLLMPGMSGFEVVKFLKADHYTRAIPVLILTAKDMTAKDKTDLNGHVEAVLSKGSLASMDLVTWLEEELGDHAHRATSAR
jgi:signal transduction histidine kinase/CheY-like chemotaxis protein